mmetsp:Transcript_33753/g.79901  ORF Transcript_33753/g.79901 Transcript_33753/m.79901 type:complete len:214 (+) Transcript_33753:25-666(+)
MGRCSLPLLVLAAGLLLLASPPLVSGTDPTPKEAVVADHVKPSDVVLLDADNFARLMKEGTWFVNFYAPWCGHCKRMAPIWEQLATKLKASKVKVAKLDADENHEIAEEYYVRAYPTFKIINGDAVVEFAGENSLEGFVKFVEDYQKRTHAAVDEGLQDAVTGAGLLAQFWRVVTKFAGRSTGLYTVGVFGSGFFFGVLIGVLFAIREKDKLH